MAAIKVQIVSEKANRCSSQSFYLINSAQTWPPKDFFFLKVIELDDEIFVRKNMKVLLHGKHIFVDDTMAFWVLSTTPFTFTETTP